MNTPLQQPLPDADVLVERYRADVFRFVLGMVRDATLAEDLTADVFLKALRGAGGFRGDAEVSTWLFAIALNTVRSHFRRRKVLRYITFGISGEQGTDTTAPDVQRFADPRETDPVQRIALAERLLRALGALPPRQREVFLLRVVEDLPVRQVAAVLGIPEGTVKSNLFKAMVRLREELDDEL